MYMGRTTTKIDEHVLDNVRKHVKSTGQTVFSFLNMTLEEKLKELYGVNMYRSKMTEFLGEAINGTRKTKRK